MQLMMTWTRLSDDHILIDLIPTRVMHVTAAAEVVVVVGSSSSFVAVTSDGAASGGHTDNGPTVTRMGSQRMKKKLIAVVDWTRLTVVGGYYVDDVTKNVDG